MRAAISAWVSPSALIFSRIVIPGGVQEGQEFVTNFAKPLGFCDWAWNDIHQYVAVLLAEGNFAGSLFDGWMKDEKTMIACCTDGIRPVIFKLERIAD